MLFLLAAEATRGFRAVAPTGKPAFIFHLSFFSPQSNTSSQSPPSRNKPWTRCTILA